MKTPVTFDYIDLSLLMRQKESLVLVINDLPKDDLHRENLEGILNLLDYITDCLED